VTSWIWNQIRNYALQIWNEKVLVPDRVVDLDPDPHGSALIWVAGSRYRRANINHKTRKKLRIFMFWSAGCSLLRTEGFSCSLGILYGGKLIKKIKIKIPAVLVHFW
jgi:hypothetical protein